VCIANEVLCGIRRSEVQEEKLSNARNLSTVLCLFSPAQKQLKYEQQKELNTKEEGRNFKNPIVTSTTTHFYT